MLENVTDRNVLADVVAVVVVSEEEEEDEELANTDDDNDDDGDDLTKVEDVGTILPPKLGASTGLSVHLLVLLLVVNDSRENASTPLITF